MPWLVSIFVSLISGLVALFLAGYIANACVIWYQISSREGLSGYFIIFVALGGGFAGLILGLIVTRSIAANFGPSFAKELMGSLAAVLLLAGVSAWMCRMLADVPPKIEGCELNLEVEFRFPNTLGPETPPTLEGDWQFTFSSLSGQTPRKSQDGTIQTAIARYENGQWIVPTQVSLFTERGRRSVTLYRREATEVIGFLLPLPARPGAEFEQWSKWTPKQQANGQAWPADKMSCRFRIQKITAPVDPHRQ